MARLVFERSWVMNVWRLLYTSLICPAMSSLADFNGITVGFTLPNPFVTILTSIVASNSFRVSVSLLLTSALTFNPFSPFSCSRFNSADNLFSNSRVCSEVSVLMEI